GGRLEGIARAVVLFQQVLGAVKIHVDVEVLLDFRLDVGHLLDQRKFIDGLRVVGDRPIRIDCDRHRPHAEEAEGNQAEGTTSFTWRDSTDVNPLTSSGISAPASVPQEMIEASFHHCVGSGTMPATPSPSLGMMKYETK